MPLSLALPNSWDPNLSEALSIYELFPFELIKEIATEQRDAF